MKAKEIKGAIYLSHDRLNCSQYGNPRARVWFRTQDGEEMNGTTATDAAAGYAVSNWEYNKVAKITTHRTRNGNLIIDYIETRGVKMEG